MKDANCAGLVGKEERNSSWIQVQANSWLAVCCTSNRLQESHKTLQQGL